MLSKTMKLRHYIKQIVIVAHKEDISDLYSSLIKFNLPLFVQRKIYDNIELGYPSITRCLLNHADAWMRATECDGYTLICEADFVPIIGFEDVSMEWLPIRDTAWAHLYTSSPRLLKPYDGYLRIQQSTAVCYMINDKIGRLLSGFVNDYRVNHGFESLHPWDSDLQWYAMGQGAELYMPLKSLGEHGGIANPEHKLAGMRHDGAHRADVLAARLQFTPNFKKISTGFFNINELNIKILPFLRILTGRWIKKIDEYNWSAIDVLRANLLAFKRLIF
jgi:hypothetical protein